jgi:ankyrin repeat protein
MSEIECEITLYFIEQVHFETMKSMFQKLELRDYDSAKKIVLQLGIKKKIAIDEIFIEHLSFDNNRIQAHWITSSKSEVGKTFAHSLSKFCDALLFNLFDNSIMHHETYGFIKGRKQRISKIVKELKTIDPDIALYEAADRGRSKEVEALLSKGADPNACYGTPLPIVCIYKKRKKILEALLATGADPNQAYKETGDTMLTVAAEEGRNAFIKLAIKFGADVDKPNDEGTTPLIQACRYGRLETCALLIQAGASLEARDRKGRTALMIACMSRWAEDEIGVKITQALIHAGADIHAADDSGRPVMAYANHSIRRRLLLSSGAAVYIPTTEYTDKSEKDLFIAIEHDHMEKVVELVKTPLDLNKIRSPKGDLTALEAAIDRPKILELLIDNGADLYARNKRGDTLLHKACSCGYMDTVRLLTEKGQDLNARGFSGWTPLHNATHYGYKNIVAHLLSVGADATQIDEAGSLPIVAAITERKGDAQGIVDLYLQDKSFERLSKKARYNIFVTAISCGYQPFFDFIFDEMVDVNLPNCIANAVRSMNLYAFKRLLNHGSEDCLRIEDDPAMPLLNLVCTTIVNGLKKDRATALEMFDLLIESNIQVEPKVGRGLTPLFYFQTRKGYVEQTAKLIALQADVNARTDAIDGYTNDYVICGRNVTPLMVAASRGLFENVKVLLEAGSDPSHTNYEGLTAMQLAERYGRTKVVEFLR